MVLHLPIGRLKTHSGLEPVPRCEPSTCQPISCVMFVSRPLYSKIKSAMMIMIRMTTMMVMMKEGNVLFNNALNTFYLRLYGVRHMVNNHSDSERGNPQPPHKLLFPINSMGGPRGRHRNEGCIS